MIARLDAYCDKALSETNLHELVKMPSVCCRPSPSYTAKVAGTFSACFGAPFLVWHPYVYAEMPAAKLELRGASAYLVNTGWIGGPYGDENRCSLNKTEQLINAIHVGSVKDETASVQR